MSKYQCSACQGVSDVPGVCQTDGCSNNGQPLTEVIDAPAEESSAPEMPSMDSGAAPTEPAPPPAPETPEVPVAPEVPEIPVVSEAESPAEESNSSL